MIVYIFLIVNKSQKTKSNNELILRTAILPELNTSMSHTVAAEDMLLHYDEQGRTVVYSESIYIHYPGAAKIHCEFVY